MVCCGASLKNSHNDLLVDSCAPLTDSSPRFHDPPCWTQVLSSASELLKEEVKRNAAQPLPHALRRNRVSLDLIVKRLASDPQAFGRLQLVAVRFFEHLNDLVALHRFH